MSSESRYEIMIATDMTGPTQGLYIYDNEMSNSVCDLYAKFDNSRTIYPFNNDKEHAQIICDALNNHHLKQNKTFIGRIVHAFKSAWKELRS